MDHPYEILVSDWMTQYRDSSHVLSRTSLITILRCLYKGRPSVLMTIHGRNFWRDADAHRRARLLSKRQNLIKARAIVARAFLFYQVRRIWTLWQTQPSSHANHQEGKLQTLPGFLEEVSHARCFRRFFFSRNHVNQQTNTALFVDVFFQRLYGRGRRRRSQGNSQRISRARSVWLLSNSGLLRTSHVRNRIENEKRPKRGLVGGRSKPVGGNKQKIHGRTTRTSPPPPMITEPWFWKSLSVPSLAETPRVLLSRDGERNASRRCSSSTLLPVGVFI